MDQLQKDHFKQILEKYLAGTASKDELEFLDAYYRAFGGRDGYLDALEERGLLLLKNDVKSSIHYNISTNEKNRIPEVDKRVVFRRVISIAAAVIIIIGVAIYYFPEESNPNHMAKQFPKSEIVPGGNKAILTLPNGKKISLTDADNGTLAEQAGIKIVKTTDGQLVYTILSDHKQVSSDKNQFNTIETPKGGSYQVRLPDGSNVWLNSASKLTFPSSFIAHKNRKVELNGEAYFDVASDKLHPFIVKTTNQEVEVLGTQFNINSYVDEPGVKTTLLEGSIKISKDKGTIKILKPGEQSTLTAKEFIIESVDTDQAVAWKMNQFVFDSDDIQYIMRMISRWYNVEVEYVGEIPTSKFGGAVSRFENFSEVLKTLESTGKVKFKIEGRRILVSR